jgi:hypothetical protein
MKRKKIRKPLSAVLFLLVIVLLTGCQKQKVKNHYTGDFHFTAIIHVSQDYNNPNPNVDDTIVADGQIKWLKACNINISFSQYSYNVTVEKDNSFSFTDSITNPDSRNTETLKGKFLNEDELEFTYYYTHAYMVLFSRQITVKGNRI